MDWIIDIKPKEFENFDVLARWKESESQFLVQAAMACDLLSVQDFTIASEFTFSLRGRLISIRRTRLTPASLKMYISLKNQLDEMEHTQDKVNLEDELEMEEMIHRGS